MNPSKYSFQGEVWRYGLSGWHFVTLPKPLAQKIRKRHSVAEEGWGRLKASAAIGKAKWDSAIWFDTKAGSYILPLKASVRKETGLGVGAKVKVQICIAPVNPVLKKFLKSKP